MVKAVKGRNGGTLLVYEKGESGNPNGRPRKIATSLKIQGYSPEQIRETFEVMSALTMEELTEFEKNKNLTVLEMGICTMINNFFKKGKTEFLDYIVAKKQAITTTIEKPPNYDITNKDDDEASRMYKELMSSK